MLMTDIMANVRDDEMFLKYIVFIQGLSSTIDKFETGKDITDLEEFRQFRKENLISIGDAQLVDMFFLDHCGTYWLSGYNYPNKNEMIMGLNVDNVGILTFDLTA